MELLKLLKYSFLFIPVLSFCQTKRAIMEGTPASNNTILISTDTKSVSIATTASNGYTLNVLGSINTTSYFLNGVPFSGGSGSGDNLGNHIATMTLTTNYGINTSTIQAKNMLVYDASNQPYINIMSVNYLNSPEIRFSTIATNSAWSIGNINTWNDALVFRQRGLNEKMILTQDGKLSIGVNPYPTEKLEVSGNVKADSFINTTQGTINYIVVSTALYAMNGGSGGGGSGGYTSFVIDDFSSQTNGSQKTFTLSQQPLPNSLQVSKNGLVLKSTDDYTLSGQVITMVTAPSSNTALMAMYAIGVSTNEATIIQDGSPIGSFIAYSSTISPQGYLYCDGRWINKNSYPDLFAVTGYRYSTFTLTSGDWFQLPDLRGMFLRGEDSFNVKGLGFRVIGSTQTDAFQAHKHLIHSIPWHDYPGGWSGGGWFGDPGWKPELSSDTFLEISGYGTPRIATETRPMNTAVAYHIKYANIGTATIKLSSSNVILTSNNVWTGDNTFIGNTNFNNAIFTFSSNTIFNSSISINANSSQQYALTIDSNNNTSDGYVVSITTYGSVNYNTTLVRAYQIGDTIGSQIIPNATHTKVVLNAKDYDRNNEFNTSTYRFTAKSSGYYRITVSVGLNLTDTGRLIAYIYINGVQRDAAGITAGGTTEQAANVYAIRYLNANDYVELYVYHTAGVSRNIWTENGNWTRLEIEKIP